MKHCDKCNVDVSTSRKTCPLCGEILKGDSDNQSLELFPKYQEPIIRINFVLRTLLFLAITSIIASLLVNLIVTPNNWWSIYVVISIMYLWVLLRNTIMARGNIGGKLLLQMIAVSILVIVVEKKSGSSGWALEYVVPFLIIATIFSIIIIILSKQMLYSDYIIYLIIAIIMAFIPIILYWSQVITVFWPSITAAAVALATILGMIIFADRATKDELKKRFHL